MLRALLLSLCCAGPAYAQTWALPDGRAYVAVQNPAAHTEGAVDRPLAGRLSGPTDRYSHDVLGGIPRWTELAVTLQACSVCPQGSDGVAIRLEPPLVFEDVGPRLWQVTGDATPEIVVVEAHATKGARLTVWETGGEGLTRIAATSFIGRANRWLAPVGAADFDGDGQIEIAFVDRPHLAMELVLVRRQGNRLVEVARLAGVTNHRIGESFISGGVRFCGAHPEAIVATGDWSDILAVTFVTGKPAARSLGRTATKANIDRALACR